MKATRDAFGEQLAKSAQTNEKIIAINADLSKATKLSIFQNQHPDRFIDVGIAENNMIGIASGLSEHGYKVFIASFASFLTGKYDTIRCSLSYSNSPVIIVGSHGGLAIGKDGVTQMGLEDISLMRSLPGMIVFNPSTAEEAKSIVEWICETDFTGPVYLRIGRQPVKEVWSDYGKFQFNKMLNVFSNGNEALVLSSGCILSDVLEATKDLPVTVCNVATLKPFNVDYGNFKKIITVEDHSVIGGLGTAVAEDIASLGLSAKLTKIGVQDVFPESAPPEDLYEKYGLSISKIKEKIQKAIQ